MFVSLHRLRAPRRARGPGAWRLVGAAWLVTVLGCGSAPTDPWFDHMMSTGRAEPNDAERAALERLGDLPPDRPVAVAGQPVVAGPPYTAASGRTCRSFQIGDAPARLACRELAPEEAEWVLAPEVRP